jgi:hypothetical protein
MALSKFSFGLCVDKVHKPMENSPLQAQNMSLYPINLL